MSITQFECVSVALDIQHAMRMRYIVTCGLPPLQYFSTLSHKQHVFRKTVIEHKMCVSSFSTSFSEVLFILRRSEQDMIENVYRVFV